MVVDIINGGTGKPTEYELLEQILEVLKDIRGEIAGSAQDGTPYYTRDD